MNTSAPNVTVFIPVFNREKFIGQAIDSVLSQQYPDFELLIVDDGSEDRSVEIIRAYEDPRIRIVQNPRNMGIPITRNRGLEEARGAYIAILDSDDVMLPNRLSTQIDFLDKHSDYVGIGSWSKYMDDQGRITHNIRTRPVGDKRTKASLLFHCAIHNRTFTARTSVLQEYGYNNEFPRCQDYELLVRLSKNWKLGNLPKVLVHGRKHADQITGNTHEVGDDRKCAIAAGMLDELGIKYEETDLRNHIRIARSSRLNDIDTSFYQWAEQWLLALLKANKERGIYDQTAFSQVVFKMWGRILYKYYRNSKDSQLRQLLSSSLNRNLSSYLSPPYL